MLKGLRLEVKGHTNLCHSEESVSSASLRAGSGGRRRILNDKILHSRYALVQNDVPWTTMIILLVCSFFFALTMVYAAGNDPDEAMEKEVMQQAQEQANAQLKDYFRDHYYKEGKEHLKNGRYKQAYAKFKRCLKWSPDYEPAVKSMQLAEQKIVEDYLKSHIDKLIADEPSGVSYPKTGPSLSASQEIPEGAYRVELGDMLEIFVGGHPELSKDLAVRSDGTIYFVPAGNLQAAGLTLPEIENKIAGGLSGNFKDPQVAVTVKSFGRPR